MRKRKGRPRGGAGWFPGWNFAERRQALPPKAEGGKEKAGERAKKCVYSICLLFPLFFVHLYKHKKWMALLCISLCVHKKEKNVYVKLYTANKAGVMRAYVYVCILRKCSGWFRCADFRKFCADLFAYFSAGSRRSMYVYMHKKKTKCICLHTQKKEQNAYVTYSKFEVICIA